MISFTSVNAVVPIQAHLIQEYRANVNVEAGLNQATRDLLKGLPEEVRKQAILALKEALPLIDMSVEKYLAKVDEILSKQLLAVDCTIDGAVFKALSQAGAKLNPFKTFPTDLEDLRAAAKKYHSKAKWSDTTEMHVDRLGDLINASRSIACASKGNPISYPLAEKIGSDLTETATLFLRINDKACSDPQACVEAARNQVSANLQVADKRDVAAAKAAERLSAVKVPKKPLPLVQDFDFAAYAQSLREIFAVESEVMTLSALRAAAFEGEKVKAANLLGSLQAEVDQAQAMRNASYGSVDAKYDGLTNGIGVASGVTQARVDGLMAIVNNGRDLMPKRANEFNAMVESSVQLFGRARSIEGSLRGARTEHETHMHKQCDDTCFGGKNRFCPNWKQSKPRDCH
ncbi:MAG: hypothetical protein O9327_10585 [Polaromonas sp.]|nr:hypothetical protein [Polaromonas sp.]